MNDDTTSYLLVDKTYYWVRTIQTPDLWEVGYYDKHRCDDKLFDFPWLLCGKDISFLRTEELIDIRVCEPPTT
jgi:hypothetical protein